jgi:hypothetical protein
LFAADGMVDLSYGPLNVPHDFLRAFGQDGQEKGQGEMRRHSIIVFSKFLCSSMMKQGNHDDTWNEEEWTAKIEEL